MWDLPVTLFQRDDVLAAGATVRGSMPNHRVVSRRLNPSTQTARRTLA
jgi:hypothetical protein